MLNKNIWKDKIVLITGHTGFKGSWLSIWLKMLGAEVIGYDDFMNHGSITAAKKQGLVRSEGKSYPVKDGDIINYLFNV